MTDLAGRPPGPPFRPRAAAAQTTRFSSQRAGQHGPGSWAGGGGIGPGRAGRLSRPGRDRGRPGMAPGTYFENRTWT